LQNSLKKIL